MNTPQEDGGRTRSRQYTDRLLSEGGRGWKQTLDVQRPYRWNLRRLHLGRCLDVGCGIGRNLAGLAEGSVGVDHNAASVAECRSRGLEAYTPAEFLAHGRHGLFDSMLVAHVLEHLDEGAAQDLLGTYLPFVRPQGKIVVITPQERGFDSDDTHVRWVDFARTRRHFQVAGVHTERQYSFPLPRRMGRFFYANEFVSVGVRE
jgi:2-polyprenyl-3-methyl-5-hydroxy-6-metoxy-1,4-benzoquinol methylase